MNLKASIQGQNSFYLGLGYRFNTSKIDPPSSDRPKASVLVALFVDLWLLAAETFSCLIGSCLWVLSDIVITSFGKESWLLCFSLFCYV